MATSPQTETLCTTAASPACGSVVAAGSSVNEPHGDAQRPGYAAERRHRPQQVLGRRVGAGREAAGHEHLPGRGCRAAGLAGRGEGAAADTWIRRHLPDRLIGWPGAICWPPVTDTDVPHTGASMPACRLYGGSWFQVVGQAGRGELGALHIGGDARRQP